MGIHKLMLHPGDPEASPPDVARLVEQLRQIHLIGPAFAVEGGTHYYAGERFLELIAFLGCSPNVALDPPVGADGQGTRDWASRFCHTTFREFQEVEFVRGSNVVSPRCPRCRQRDDAWQDAIGAWRSARASYRWHCRHCGLRTRPQALDWRQSAGFGRLLVEIWGIHNAEAVPSDPLLNALEDTTGSKWVYFYCHDK